MSKPKLVILFDVPHQSPTLVESDYKRLCEYCEVQWLDQAGKLDPSRLAEVLSDAEVVITGWASPRLTPEILDSAKRLRLVAHAAGSVRGVIDESFFGRGIMITNAATVMAPPVAELALLLAMAGLRRLGEVIRLGDHTHDWATAKVWPNGSLWYSTVGLVGLGEIGRVAARLFGAFQCRVLGCDVRFTPAQMRKLGAEPVELNELMRRSRIVSLHAPDIPQNYRMIGAEQLALMRDGAVLVNTARGRLVDTDALVEQLRSGRIAAGLDVTDPEPLPPEHPLWQLPNCIITCHSAGPTADRQADMGRAAVDNVIALMTNKPLQGLIDAERFKTMA